MRRRSQILAHVLLLWVTGCVGTACTPSARNTPINDHVHTSQVKHTSVVLLEPARGNHAFQSWRLINKNPDTIRALNPWPGLFGSIERRSHSGEWYPFPALQGYCATVHYSSEVGPGEAIGVSELPLMGGERTLPPGQYRFVLPHIRASFPDERFAAMLPFEVGGLDARESAEIVKMLEREDVRACSDVWSFLLTTLERTGAPEVLPSLFSMQMKTFDAQIAVYTVLAHLKDHVPELVARVQDQTDNGLAAAVTLLETRRERSVRRAAVLRISAVLEVQGDPPLRAVNALYRSTEDWPDALIPQLIKLLGRTQSNQHRIAIADILLDGGPETLKSYGRPAVQAIRSAARATADENARADLLDVGAMLAERLGDEPPTGHSGRAMEALSDEDLPTEECSRLGISLRTNPLLRFTPAVHPVSTRVPLHVTYSFSYVERYREPVDNRE